MRYAVCFFGLQRTFKKCYPSLRRNFLLNFDSEIFIHTWLQNAPMRAWHSTDFETLKKVAKDLSHINLKSVDSILFETQKIESKTCFIEDVGQVIYTNPINMWMSLKSVASLVYKSSSYRDGKIEYVIFVRPDLYFFKSFTHAQYIGSRKFFFAGLKKFNEDTGGQYTCEDLFFGFESKLLGEFIEFCDEQIEFQWSLPKKKKSEIMPNPLLKFPQRVGELNPFCEFNYNRDFFILRNFSLKQWKGFISQTYLILKKALIRF